jgi:hypothetical protein
MENIEDQMKKINIGRRNGTPASLVCAFIAGILGSTAMLCIHHPDQSVQKWAMVFFFVFGASCTTALFWFLWFKPAVFRQEDWPTLPPSQTKKATAKQNPRKESVVADQMNLGRVRNSR